MPRLTLIPVRILPAKSFTFSSCTNCLAKIEQQYHVCPRCHASYQNDAKRYRVSLLALYKDAIRKVTIFGDRLDPIFGMPATDFERKYTSTNVNVVEKMLSRLLLGAHISATIPTRYVVHRARFDHMKRAIEKAEDVQDLLWRLRGEKIKVAHEIHRKVVVSDIKLPFGIRSTVSGLLKTSVSPKLSQEIHMENSDESPSSDRRISTAYVTDSYEVIHTNQSLEVDYETVGWCHQTTPFKFEEISLAEFLDTWTDRDSASEPSAPASQDIEDGDLVALLDQLSLYNSQLRETHRTPDLNAEIGELLKAFQDDDEYDDPSEDDSDLIAMLEGLAL